MRDISFTEGQYNDVEIKQDEFVIAPHPALIALEKSFSPSPLSPINDPLLVEYGIELWLKRDDLLHPIISGNKWRKLKYNLNNALKLNKDTLISMGGAHSNHLHALAYTGKLLNLKTQGFIRGEQAEPATATLKDLQDWGMQLSYISRTDYRELRHYTDLPNIKPNEYWIPEGGATELALKGVAELVAEIDLPYDIICAPCGTGATLAGIISATAKNTSVLGFAALKNASFLNNDVTALLHHDPANWQINLDYHFGGFAKTTPELLNFIKKFNESTGIVLEPLYTGKMLYALYDLITKHTFKPGQRIIAIHTGGLQGLRGFNE